MLEAIKYSDNKLSSILDAEINPLKFGYRYVIIYISLFGSCLQGRLQSDSRADAWTESGNYRTNVDYIKITFFYHEKSLKQ
jgi:hypothetical protein